MAETRIMSHLATDLRQTAPSCEDGLLLVRLLVISASPPPPVRSSDTFIRVPLVAISVLGGSRTRSQRTKGRSLGIPSWTWMLNLSLMTQRKAIEPVAAVMAAAAGSGDAEKGLTAPVVVEGLTSTVVSTMALRASLRTTLKSILLMRPPRLLGDSGYRSPCIQLCSISRQLSRYYDDTCENCPLLPCLTRTMFLIFMFWVEDLVV
jgi:hypothetical protein